MQLYFHGGARSVTGANFLLEAGGKKILVDCGLRQGIGFCDELNCDDFPYDPADIDAVFVTHAHIDHTGRLPKLVRDGYKGKVYSTPPTRDFAEHLLLDSEHIMKKETDKLNRPPLYGTEDVEELMTRWEGMPYHKEVSVGGIKITAYNAGHILGSSFYVVEAEGKKIMFSGDLGNFPAPIINPTEFFEGADYCVTESTYGGRVHEAPERRQEALEDAIEETAAKGGVLMIPSFAMERTQDLLYQMNELVENGRVPRMPVFLDSPLAIKLTAVYRKYNTYFNDEARELIAGGDKIFNFPGLKMTLQTAQSKEINDVPAPKIIIAGSGMMQGGRMIHHARRYLSDEKNTLLFIGYQAGRSLGRRILDGAKGGKPFSIKIFGETVPVRCRVAAIGGYSAHADQPRLLEWLGHSQKTLKKVFVCMGEDDEAEALAAAIQDKFSVEAMAPSVGDVAVIE